jgi:O-methyltransferase
MLKRPPEIEESFADAERRAVSAFAAVPWKKKLAYMLFPNYSFLLDQVNNNALVKNWLKEHSEVPVLTKRVDLWQFIEDKYLKGEAINYLEFGVWQGDSIQTWSSISANPASRFVGFDSFRGLPEDWNAAMKKGRFDVAGAVPNIDDNRVSFVEGWFQNTLPKFLEGFQNDKRLVVHNDCDLYSSTAYCLAKLDALFHPGAIIIFDDFSSPLDVFRAWNDYLRAFMRKAKPIAMTAIYAGQAAFMFE